MKRNELEGRRNPEGNEIEENMGAEIKKLKLALDGKINELKKFKEGYTVRRTLLCHVHSLDYS